jgi:hypothetical protein
MEILGNRWDLRWKYVVGRWTYVEIDGLGGMLGGNRW